MTAVTCPPPANECITATCTGGFCGHAFVANMVATITQTAGDCHKKVCDGAGNVLDNVDDTDAPDDGKPCTTDACSAGTASHTPKTIGTSCGATNVCDALGNCVGCTQPSECGANAACKTFSCIAGMCSSINTAAGTVVANTVVGDCRSDQCDGSGGISVGAVDNNDKPADDGDQCTLDTCGAGAPAHPVAPAGTACNQGGGSTCNATGMCVSCTLDSQCPAGGPCQAAKCNAGSCGVATAAAHVLPAGQQVAGDCQQLACDGTSQAPVSTADNADVPADDGKICTQDTCAAGVPVHTPVTINTACNQGGGSFCDAAGNCVQCTATAQCTAVNACQTPLCTAAGACSFTPVASGTVVANPAVGDCKSNQCDGAGNITVGAADGADISVDGNQCTGDVCTAGVASNPALAAGTACSQTGGTVCDGLGSCVGAPVVTSVSPNDSASPTASAPASTAVTITFSLAMNPATLTAQTAVGACSGSIQVSVNDFATCVGFAAAAPVMNGANSVATLVPAPGLLISRLHKVRVTTAAASATAIPLAATYTSSTGFNTTNPLPYNAGVVISQVYGGGGNTGATYKNDFIELHNRGTSAVSVAGWSVQYASATGTGSWAVTNLTGTIQPGAYYLIAEAPGAGGTTSLPTPDVTPPTPFAMASAAAKVALVTTTTALSGACPTGAQIVDLVGYGTTANCSETAPTANLSNSAGALRNLSGCVDNNNNATDFTVAAPTPRNSSASSFICATAQNEAGTPGEIAYCSTQFPLSLNVTAGASTPTVYGRIYQPTVTEAAGANAAVTAQLGYGPATANPEYEAGWTWVATTYNVQVGNNDEYQATFSAPAAGSYRYVYRFSLDGGASWTYCDNNQSDSGAGSNGGLTFDFENEGVLTSN